MLRELQERYSLGGEWGSIDEFAQTVNVGGSLIELSGFSVVGADGEQVTGSAAAVGPRTSCVRRSYFELLERVSVLSAMRHRGAEYEQRDRAGRATARMCCGEVFPESPRPHRWRPSRSNGVAVHDSWREACDRAAAELVERDRLLRSWYGESVPRRSALPGGLIPEGLHSLAEWRCYDLVAGAHGVGDDLSVVMVVGIPRSDETPLAYGSAGRSDPGDAMQAAALEAVQRFAFLWGEEIPGTPPELSPSAAFHQEFFLHPPSRPLLMAWLDGFDTGEQIVADETHQEVASSHPVDGSLSFVDLTPKHLRGLVFVVKALSHKAEPLVFGEPAPHRSNSCSRRRVHPIC